MTTQKTPDSVKGFLKLLITIAEEGNRPRSGFLTQQEHSVIGGIIADIQNELGENRDMLAKFGLEYTGG